MTHQPTPRPAVPDGLLRALHAMSRKWDALQITITLGEAGDLDGAKESLRRSRMPH